MERCLLSSHQWREDLFGKKEGNYSHIMKATDSEYLLKSCLTLDYVMIKKIQFFIGIQLLVQHFYISLTLMFSFMHSEYAWPCKKNGILANIENRKSIGRLIRLVVY